MREAEALADLKEISAEVETAVIFDAAGTVRASTLADAGRSRELARLAQTLVMTAESVRPRHGEALVQLEVATRSGSVFVAREGDRAVLATTQARPTVGLVLYDLKACLSRMTAAGNATGAEDRAAATP